MERERIHQRLCALRSELTAGNEVMARLDAKRAELERTLLRISGAIEVLEELLGDEANNSDDMDGSGECGSEGATAH